MPPKRSRTHGDPEHEAASGSASAPVNIDLPQGTPRDSGTELDGPVDTLFPREHAPLGVRHSRSTTQAECEDNGEDGSSTPLSPVISRTDDTRTAPDAAPVLSMSSGPPNRFGGLAPSAPQPFDVTPPADTRQGLVVQTNLSIGLPAEVRVVQRTHLVWMPAGDIPSIIRTSPTPPPARHVSRRRPNFAPAHDASGLSAQESSRHVPRPVNRSTESEQDSGSDSVSGRKVDGAPVPELMADCREVSPRAAEGPSRRRTLAEYDRTNARIRALNAELLSDPSSRPLSHSYHTSAQWTPRSGLRYLNVPGAAVDALMTEHRPRDPVSRGRASSDGTGIVDISESESSEFESDEEGGGFGRTFTPGGTETEVAAGSDPLVSHPERLERAATIPAELLDRATVADPYSAIINPGAPPNAHRSQGQRVRADPFVHDHTSERLQPEQGTLTSSTLLPPALHRPGKKRSRGPDLDGERVRAEGLAREDKRRKAVPGASASAT